MTVVTYKRRNALRPGLVNDHESKNKKLSDNEFCLETDNNDKDDLKCSDALVAEKILIVSLIQ
ncbi:hypothetical protein V1477_011730 [Vespula maculifrons]|uniref:Uncharacterized protein n=1 Tax=Vespula maculifrons TaxID=7453 RepID=A0ABD2C011_VESMC